MRRVALVRHAHAVPGAESRDDFSRRLRGKGKRAAHAMATWYRSSGLGAGVLLSSPADRALETAVIFAAVLGLRDRDVRTDPRLYDAVDSDDLLAILRGLDDTGDGVLVFGHNPALSSFARDFVAGFDGDMPKCAVVAATAPQRAWAELRLGGARLDLFQTPRGLERDTSGEAA